MRQSKIYEASDKMVSLISDNYNVLQSLGSFGINLGFGDKTVEEICADNKVDTYTFLAVVNFTANGMEHIAYERLSVETLLGYLKASHFYYIDFQLPFIRRELADSIDPKDQLGDFILKCYDGYAQEVTKHMRHEEKVLFPYVERLLAGKVSQNYTVDEFAKHHQQANKKLMELKGILIKYLPNDKIRNNQLMACLHDIYNHEEWLEIHAKVEDLIFAPAIRLLEEEVQQTSVKRNISNMVRPQTGEPQEELSDREKDIVVCLVQGMANKEIADHLCISLNTVMTHRRNIAKKLQIHSPAGLTVYAIIHGMVDINL